jgi:hypothetical protein
MKKSSILSSPKGKRKVSFVSPDITEAKIDNKKARIEDNHKFSTDYDESKIDELTRQNEGEAVPQERQTKDICMISPEPTNASTDGKKSCDATDLNHLFIDENSNEDVWKVIEIVNLNADRRGILINKSWTIHDVIERESDDNSTEKKIVLKESDDILIFTTIMKLSLMKFLIEIFRITLYRDKQKEKVK